ncbi:hypothetical protein MTBBW1_2260007 [Desulfamplus magnetovallimortis]|uniref:Uncharacterized protein n=1 Tax=Desulfamplus magnetovallimortis TaxID=1246637 RepID=A0A1W1HD82_9BACT|nr:hypothetical protein MTBBW1_2260007 [Desulfamplus magnetovallimortis]
MYVKKVIEFDEKISHPLYFMYSKESMGFNEKNNEKNNIRKNFSCTV